MFEIFCNIVAFVAFIASIGYIGNVIWNAVIDYGYHCADQAVYGVTGKHLREHETAAWMFLENSETRIPLWYRRSCVKK